MKNIIDEHLWQEIISPDSFSGEIRFMEPMKNHTSLRIGGPADVFAFLEDVISLKNMLSVLKENGIPFIPVGGGTNLLVRDGGIEGVVVSLRGFRRFTVIEEGKEQVMLFIEAGVPLQRLVNFSRENGYSGIEGLVGIPGFVGGAIAGNAGAFGYEIKDVLASATVMYADSRIDRLNTYELSLEYRTSRIPAGTIILSGNMTLRKDVKEDIAKKIDGFMRERREKQPISEWSAGCVFKNPEGIPASGGAGKLIDEAGCKGMRIGDVEVSSMHANFFVNKGNANAEDFIRLMDEVRTKVMKVFGIGLEPEIRIVGRE